MFCNFKERDPFNFQVFIGIQSVIVERSFRIFFVQLMYIKEDRAALLVAMDAVSDRMTAIVREREGLAYRLGAGVRPIPGGAWILSAWVGTRPENSQRVVELLKSLVADLGTERLSSGDLERLNARARRTRMLRGLSAASRHVWGNHGEKVFLRNEANFT